MAMEKRIALECGNLDKAEVTCLNLDHCKSLQICGLTKDFVALETLSLINNGLTSLDGFPPLLKLRKLELADNFLSGGFEVLEACPNLQKINLSGNKIKDIESLRPLSKLSNLVSLDLYSNEITSSEAFPQNVKQILPNVQSFCEDELEGLSSGDEEEDDQDDEYEDEEDDEGSGDEIIRPLEGNGLGSSGGKSGPSINGVTVGGGGPEDEEEDSDDEAYDNDAVSGDEEEEVDDDGHLGEEGPSDIDDDEEDEDEDEDDDDEEEEGEGSEGPGLAYLYGKDLKDEDDDVEYRASSKKQTNGSKEESEDGGDLGPTAPKQKKLEQSETGTENKVPSNQQDET